MKVKLLSEGAKIPTRAKYGDAGYDLFAPNNVKVKPGRNVIPLDISVELDHLTEAQVRPRSGFSIKGMEGYALSDNELKEPKRYDADVIIGTVDEGFRGVVGVIIKSFEKDSFMIKAGTKIAQMVIEKYCDEPFIEVDELSESERGVNGFGHTGTM